MTADSKDIDYLRAELGRIEQRFKEVVDENDKRYDQRFQEAQSALRVALQANDRRLDGMNEFRQAINDAASRTVTRAEMEANLASLDERITSTYKPLQTSVEAFGRPNYTLIGSFVSIILVMVTGIWLVLGLKIDNSAIPLALSVEQIKTSDVARDRSLAAMNTLTTRNAQELLSLGQTVTAGSTLQSQVVERLHTVESDANQSQQADIRSTADRGQLNERVRTIEAQISAGLAARNAQVALIENKLREVETQFHAINSLIGLLTDHTQQWIGILYEKLYPGQRFPRVAAPTPVYPSPGD